MPKLAPKNNIPLTIPVIVGPTSSGKTSLALELCKRNGAAIISADSRQIYKHMDIGTGKVPVASTFKIVHGKNKWVLDGVDVYGYDLAEPDQFFSGYDYALFALNKARELMEANKKFVIVGGTGFYIDLFTGKRKLDGNAPDLQLREELEKVSLSDLLEKLKSLNTEVYDQVDKANKVRILRAVEKELSQKETKELPYLSNANFALFGLTAPRETLYQKVDLWAETVWKSGLMIETKNLLKKYPKSLKLQGLVYKTVIEFLSKKLSETEAIQRTKWDLHAYIRRQLTWFRKNSNIKWFDTSVQSAEQVISLLETYAWGALVS